MENRKELPSGQNEYSAKTQEEREKESEIFMKKLLEELKQDTNVMSASYQLKRLINTNYVNPYETLMLTPEASEEEIRKQYRQISLLIHPDKCQDPSASDAFHSKNI